MKRPSYSRTFTFFARLGALLTFGKVAASCGKEVQTAEAWGREPASNEYPAGSGKRNPMDCILRLMGLAHKENDLALVHEIAETFQHYANYLEGKTFEQPSSLNEIIGASVKEHSEAIVAALNVENPNFAKAHTEIVQAEVAMRRLKVWVVDEMKGETEKIVARNGDKR